MILVTGATGTIGRPLVHLLAASGQPVRALARHPEAPHAVLARGVETLQGDLSRHDTLVAALRGVTALFVHPRAVGESAAALLALAAEHGVKKVAVLSAINVDEDLAWQPSRANGDRNKEVEDAVTGSGLPWVSVRPCSFAVNTIAMWGAQARSGDVVGGPYAEFADALIHEDDVASVLARALLDPSLIGQTISVTGPQSLTHAQMVATIGEVIGRPLRYEELPAAVAAEAMVSQGIPSAFVDAMMARYAREIGQPAVVTDGVNCVLGRRAHSYAEWVADHAAAFRQSPSTAG